MSRSHLTLILSLVAACASDPKPDGSDSDTTSAVDTDAVVAQDTDLPGDTDAAPSGAIRGWVTDVTGVGLAVVGATVRVGAHETTTNEYGMFRLEGLPPGEHQIVEVLPPGPGMTRFSHAVDVFVDTTTPLEVHLATMVSDTFDAASGGTVQAQVGRARADITIPPNALTHSDGSPAVGEVTLYAAPFDVSSSTSSSGTFGWDTVSGDMSGVDAQGGAVQLVSYGMVSVELFDATGEALNLAPDTLATLSITVDPALLADAPETVPLWHFDDAAAAWREEGQATLTDGAYVGEVPHFSTWNADSAADLCTVSGRIKWVESSPVGSGYVSATGINYGYQTQSSTQAGGFSVTVRRGWGATITPTAVWLGVSLNGLATTVDAAMTGGAAYDLGTLTLPYIPPPAAMPNCIDLSALPDGSSYDSDNAAAINLVFGTQYTRHSSEAYNLSDLVVAHVDGGWDVTGPSSMRLGNPALTAYGIAETPTIYTSVASVRPADHTWIQGYEGLSGVGTTNLLMFTRDGLSFAGQFKVDGANVSLCYTLVTTLWK